MGISTCEPCCDKRTTQSFSRAIGTYRAAHLQILCDTLAAITSGDAGDATAANQVLEIAALNSILTQVTISSGAVSGGREQVNVSQINGVAPSMGNGISGTGVQRVTLASDSTGLLAATQSGTWNVTVNTALPAGTNAIGKLAANSGVIIGDVNVVSNIPGVGATNLGKAEDAAHVSGDTGIAVWGVSNEALATFGADGDYTPIGLDTKGRVITRLTRSGATLSSVASSASNVTILAANTSRLGATIFNDSTQVLYLKFGATASTSSYTVQLVSNGYYEVPFGYSGIIDGIWASANGNARITELS